MTTKTISTETYYQLTKSKLIKRYKRFLADVELENGEVITIHCPNTGAMTGCAEPGFTAYFSTSDNPKRKYPNTFELVQNHRGEFIGVNTIRANQLVFNAIIDNKVPELSGYSKIYSEVKYGEQNSRIDLLLTDDSQPNCYIEVKSTTLLLDDKQGIGAFPDAVTLRGQKHLEELIHIKSKGYRAVLVFLVQHTGIKQITVARHIDPKYAKLLAKAVQSGVEILVMHTHIDANSSYVSHTSEFNLELNYGT